MIGGIFDVTPPATVDLVLSRRDTGAEVLRLTLEDTVEADFTLDAVNHDLGRDGAQRRRIAREDALHAILNAVDHVESFNEQ